MGLYPEAAGGSILCTGATGFVENIDVDTIGWDINTPAMSALAQHPETSCTQGRAHPSTHPKYATLLYIWLHLFYKPMVLDSKLDQ